MTQARAHTWGNVEFVPCTGDLIMDAYMLCWEDRCSEIEQRMLREVTLDACFGIWFMETLYFDAEVRQDHMDSTLFSGTACYLYILFLREHVLQREFMRVGATVAMRHVQTKFTEDIRCRMTQTFEKGNWLALTKYIMKMAMFGYDGMRIALAQGIIMTDLFRLYEMESLLYTMGFTVVPPLDKNRSVISLFTAASQLSRYRDFQAWLCILMPSDKKIFPLTTYHEPDVQDFRDIVTYYKTRLL